MIGRYTRPEMQDLWSQENRFQAWLEVEIAVCEAWHELGLIPAKDMENIRKKAGFDLARILEIEEKTKHDVIAFLTAVEEKVGASARFIHLGCTSSDIVDTANGLLLMRAGKIIAKDIENLLSVLKDMAFTHKGRLMMGRTHGIHAEPTSFGLKIAGFYAEFMRHKERFTQALKGVSVGKISGAVGTYANINPEVERLTCKTLGLYPDPVSTQIIQRDRHGAFFTVLACMAGGVERLCVELRHLQRTEVLEVEESFGKGQKGSSAMPHKKNPISAENLTGLARLVRSNALAALENQALWHERDISHSSVERVIMPDSTGLMNYMLNRLRGVLENLRILPDNMERNLRGSYELFFSQRLLMALLEATDKPRQEVYEMVQAVAMRCWDAGLQFSEEVKKEPSVTAILSPEKLETVFDYTFYLTHEDMIYKRVFGSTHG